MGRRPLERPSVLRTPRLDDLSSGLNSEQAAAVAAPPGPVLVLAGAGSGKTRTLIHRLAYLIENGVSPSNILLLTFTNKAAREMIDRAAQLLPHDFSQVWAGTFHSIGYRMLRRRRARLGEPPLTVLDRGDAEQLLRSAYVEAGIDPKSKHFPKPTLLASLLSYATNTRTPLPDVVKNKHEELLDDLEAISAIFAVYERKKRESHTADFDDLLSGALALLTADPAELEFYRRAVQFILVDEYQDTNAIQSDLVDLIAGEAANVTAVGDDAQSIYSWRGADYRNILEFPKRYPKAAIFRIEANYRSVPGILAVANASICNNKVQFPKRLAPMREDSGTRPIRAVFPDSDAQARFVAERVAALIEEGVEPGDIAILYRAHHHSMEIQMALTQAGFAFDITSGLRFFELAHVKDIAAWLRFATNPMDEASFMRLVKMLPGVGDKTAESLWSATRAALDTPAEPGNLPPGTRLAGIKPPKKAAAEWQQLCHTLNEIANPDPAQCPSPQEAIRIVIEAGYGDYLKKTYPDAEDRLDDLDELASFAAGFEDLPEMLAQLSLLTDPGEGPERRASARRENAGSRLTLSTIHQAKGLEWPVVFLVWLSEGAFPPARAAGNPDAIEEERRLFYVATTRARDQLYLTRPIMRSGSGWGDYFPKASRFLEEIPRELTENWDTGGWPF